MPKPTCPKFAIILLTTIILSGVYFAVPRQARTETKCASQDYFEDHYDECSSLIKTTSKKLEDVRNQKNSINQQIQNYLSTLTVTDAQIADLKTKIQQVQAQLTEIEKNLNNRKGSLEEKTLIRNKIVRSFYQMGRANPVEILFAIEEGENSGQDFVMRDIFEDTVAEEVIKQIISLNMEIKSFESDKEEAGKLRADLEESQKTLLSLKADIDRKKAEA